jgi:hypothetical protein
MFFDRGALAPAELAVVVGAKEILEFSMSHVKLSSPGSPPGVI